MTDAKAVTVYHDTNKKLEILRAGTWVSLNKEEAMDYAAALACAIMEKQVASEKWLLELELTPDRINWQDKPWNNDNEGQHGILLSDTQIIDAVKLPN